MADTGHPSNNITRDNVAELFTYHRPTPEQLPRFEAITTAAQALALAILQNAPACADRTAAIRQVREARMMANAAIACEPRPSSEG